MSAQAGDALTNASFALDVVRSLEPIRGRLLADGVPLELSTVGHAWGFKDRTVFSDRRGPQPGDVALRVEPGAVLRRLYRVLATYPGEPEIAYAVNQRSWIEQPAGSFRNTVVFEPFIEIPPRPYVETLQRFNADFEAGFNFRGKFLDELGRGERVLEVLLGSPLVGELPPAPSNVAIAEDRRSRRVRTTQQLTRPSNAAFRAKVFHAQRDAEGRIACSACDVTDEDLLEAAHIIDEGYADDEWWNGLPMCRNHHRLFDLGKLRLHPETGAWTARRYSGADSHITKPDVGSLLRAPSAAALQWKWDSDA